jgi:hypothetical protein
MKAETMTHGMMSASEVKRIRDSGRLFALLPLNFSPEVWKEIKEWSSRTV